jgi:hypothetical protein
MMQAKAGQDSLFRVLRAVSSRMRGVGYCQGLNFVVATVQTVLVEEEEAFYCCLALLLRHKVGELFHPQFPRLSIITWQFDRLVDAFLPKLGHFFQEHGITSEYYAIQWFMTLYTYELPIETVLPILDRFLVSGWKVLHRVGLALLYSAQEELLKLDIDHLLRYLKGFVRKDFSMSATELLDIAQTFRVTNRMLAELERRRLENPRLYVAKDLDTGKVHWSVRPTQADDVSSSPNSYVLPQGSPAHREEQAPAADDSVLPFLIHNLDTGQTSLMSEAFEEVQLQRSRSACTHESFWKRIITGATLRNSAGPAQIPQRSVSAGNESGSSLGSSLGSISSSLGMTGRVPSGSSLGSSLGMTHGG